MHLPHQPEGVEQAPSGTGPGHQGPRSERTSRRSACGRGRRVRRRNQERSHVWHLKEGQRITEGLGRLELLRTQEIILRHLQTGRYRIVDIGGGTAVHAEWLASEGHDVHVIDLVPDHVERVKQLPRSRGAIIAEVGDSRQLPAHDNSFDTALLLGRLYDLTERGDRLRAWAEARRVVRPGGLVFRRRHLSILVTTGWPNDRSPR